MLHYRKVTLNSLATLGLLITIATASTAQTPHDAAAESGSGFRRIEQPLWAKTLVTTSGLGFIGLQLWWFLFSQPKTGKARNQNGVQEVTVTVDGGYEPSQIVVQAGLPVRLNFHRLDSSSCLEEVRFPDFRIAKALPINQTTAIEFIPDQPGRYEFACGMNMFRGTVEVVDDSMKTNFTDLATAAKSP